jgi:hypothetical protein
VELKLSKGSVVHGYEKQIEVYKTAARSKEAMFLIIDVGDMRDKLSKIKSLQQTYLARGDHVTEIVVIDAKKKPSASKR